MQQKLIHKLKKTWIHKYEVQFVEIFITFLNLFKSFRLFQVIPIVIPIPNYTYTYETFYTRSNFFEEENLSKEVYLSISGQRYH